VEDGSGNIVNSLTTALTSVYSIDVRPGTYTVRGTYWDDDGHADGTITPVVVTAGGTTAGVAINATDDADTANFRWAWAKCVSAYAVHNPKRPKNMLHLVAKFEVAEGVCYAGTRVIESRDEGDAGTFNLTPTGNYITQLKHTLTAGGAITQAVITNNDNSTSITWAGTLGAGNDLIIDSGARSITNNGVDAYAELTLGASQVDWSFMEPGYANVNHSFTVAVTGTPWDLDIEYWDTFILG